MTDLSQTSSEPAVSIPGMIETAGRFSGRTIAGLVFKAFGLLVLLQGQGIISGVIALGLVGFGASLTARAMLGAQVGAGVSSDGWRSVAVYYLITFVFSLAGFVVALALIIFSVVLVVASGHEPSGVASTDTDASLQALRNSGAIWILYALLAAGAGVLIWFALRLTLAVPATLTAQRIHVFRTWGQTKGQIRSLVGVCGFALLPAILMGLIAFQLNLGASWVSIGLLGSLYLLQAASVAMFQTLKKREKASSNT